MQSIFYDRAGDVAEALRLGAAPGAKFIGGGTNLLDLYKGGVEQPQRLVDISRLALAGINALPDGGVRIGALASNSAAANHPLVRQRYPLLAQALLEGATAQLRNMATVGGNLLQRTRCYYFMDPNLGACNKRTPGSGCAAIEGYNRIHAIFGASEACIAVHPSDMAVALCALDATVQLSGPQGERSVPIADFHRLPGDTPWRDANLADGELITAVDLPPSPFATHSHYVKVRDRASYAFALVSVAAALALEDGVVTDLRIVLGGVAHRPWRSTGAEDALRGQALSDEGLAAAAEAAIEGARPFMHNAFKVELARRTVMRAVRQAGETV